MFGGDGAHRVSFGGGDDVALQGAAQHQPGWPVCEERTQPHVQRVHLQAVAVFTALGQRDSRRGHVHAAVVHVVMTAVPHVVATILAGVTVGAVVVVLACAVVRGLVAVLFGRLTAGAGVRPSVTVPLVVMGCVPGAAVGHVVTFGAGVVLRHRRGELYSVAGICALPPGVDKNASRMV